MFTHTHTHTLITCLLLAPLCRATSVVMFFLEASVIGHCVDKLAFLLAINKYLKHWHRAVLYIGQVSLMR